MKNILILITALFFISACGDDKTNQNLREEGHADVSQFVNFPEKMNNCELHKLHYTEPDYGNTYLFTVVCPHSTVSTSYMNGKQQMNVSVSAGDLNKQVISENDQVTELFKQKLSFFDNINTQTVDCSLIENQNSLYSCSATQSKIVDNKIVENLISMKCNQSECTF